VEMNESSNSLSFYTPKEVEKESEFELSFISTVLREGKKLYG